MKKKIDYESKYFSQKKDKKNIQTYIVLGFLTLIFFIIILALFFLFGNKDETGKINLKYDDFEIKREIRLLLKLKEYEILNSKIDEYLNQKIDKELKKNLLYLKVLILITLNDTSEINLFIEKYKKSLTNEDYCFLKGYSNYLIKNYKNSKEYLIKIRNTNSLYRDSAIILAKIFIEEKNLDEAIKVLVKIQDKDDVILYNLAYLYLIKNDLSMAQFYVNQIGKTIKKIENISFKIDLLKLHVSIENENWEIAKDSLENLKDYKFLEETYLYNLILVDYKSKIDQNNYSFFLEKLKEEENSFSYPIYQLIFVTMFFNNMDNLAISFFEENKDKILQKEYEKYYALILYLYNKNKNYDKIINQIDFNLLNLVSKKYFPYFYRIYYESMINEKQYDKFLEISNNLLKFRDEKYLILSLIIDSMILQKKYDDGINYLLNSSILSNYPPYYYLLLAKLYIEKGDEKNAIKNFKIIEKMNLDGYDKDNIYSFICYYYLKTKKLDDFKKLFSLISDEGKKKKENINLLFKYDFLIKNYDEIIELSGKLPDNIKEDKTIIFYIAKAYYEKKQYSQAIIFFSKLIEKVDNFKEKSIFAIYIGNCNAYLGNYSTAKFFYKQALIFDKEQTYSIVNNQILEKYGK